MPIEDADTTGRTHLPAKRAAAAYIGACLLLALGVLAVDRARMWPGREQAEWACAEHDLAAYQTRHGRPTAVCWGPRGQGLLFAAGGVAYGYSLVDRTLRQLARSDLDEVHVIRPVGGDHLLLGGWRSTGSNGTGEVSAVQVVDLQTGTRREWILGTPVYSSLVDWDPHRPTMAWCARSRPGELGIWRFGSGEVQASSVRLPLQLTSLGSATEDPSGAVTVAGLRRNGEGVVVSFAPAGGKEAAVPRAVQTVVCERLVGIAASRPGGSGSSAAVVAVLDRSPVGAWDAAGGANWLAVCERSTRSGQTAWRPQSCLAGRSGRGRCYTALAWAADGGTLAMAVVPAGSAQPADVLAWNRECGLTMVGHFASGVDALLWSPDGSALLALASGAPYVCEPRVRPAHARPWRDRGARDN